MKVKVYTLLMVLLLIIIDLCSLSIDIIISNLFSTKMIDCNLYHVYDSLYTRDLHQHYFHTTFIIICVWIIVINVAEILYFVLYRQTFLDRVFIKSLVSEI